MNSVESLVSDAHVPMKTGFTEINQEEIVIGSLENPIKDVQERVLKNIARKLAPIMVPNRVAKITQLIIS